MIKTELVSVANGEYARKLAREKRIRSMQISKAKQYHFRCTVKKLLAYATILLVFIVAGIIGTVELHAEPEYVKEYEEENLYATTGIVTTVATDFIVFTDFNGNEWEVNGDSEDWDCGDIISVIMDNNGTEIIYDDEVVSTKYSGWIY